MSIPRREQEERDNEKVTLRRRAVAASPESASTHEALGDALRESDRPAAALAAYDTARQLIEATEGGSAAHYGGSGLDHKIRLTQMDLDDTQNQPKSYTARLAQRENICHQCATLNTANATHCVSCGKALPRNTLLEVWNSDEMRKPIMREFGQSIIMITIVIIALCISSWMPLEVKGVLLLSTIIVLTWKGLRAITDK